MKESMSVSVKTYKINIMKSRAIMLRSDGFIIFITECVTEIIILLIDHTYIPTQMFCLDLELKNIVNYCKWEDWENLSQGGPGSGELKLIEFIKQISQMHTFKFGWNTFVKDTCI